jgi:hypothetical protein
VSARAIGRRFALALCWLGAGCCIGAFSPLACVAEIAAFNAAFWLPIPGETARR